MKLVNPILLVCCVFLAKCRDGSSFKLSIFGGGVVVGLGRAILNATRRNSNPVLVRSSSVDEPELASDYLGDYDSGTRFEYNYDIDPIDLNYSYDYDTAADSEQQANATESDVQLNPEEVGFREQTILDVSSAPEGMDPTLTGSDYDSNVGFDDAVRQDDVSNSTSDGFTARPATPEQEIDTKDQFNLTVPDYSSNPLPEMSEGPAINLQGIFSGIISFPTEETQPIYESILSNVDYPQSHIENPEYVPDLESEDRFNPKYGLGNIAGPSVTSSTYRTRTATTTTVIPTTTITITPTSTTTPTSPAPQVQQPTAPQSTASIERAKLIARYSVYTPSIEQPLTHFVVHNEKSLRVSPSEYSTPSKPDSNSPAPRHQTSPHLFREKSSKTIVSSTAGNDKTPFSLAGTQRTASASSRSNVNPKSSISPPRMNPNSNMQQRLVQKADISSRTHQESTDKSPNGNVPQRIVPRVLRSSHRTQLRPTNWSPSGIIQQRSRPKAPIVVHSVQQKSSVSQVATVEHKLIHQAPATPQEIQRKFSQTSESEALLKSSHSPSERTAVHRRERYVTGGNPANTRGKTTIAERKVSTSKKLADGYLPRGMGIDLRFRDRLQAENESKSALAK